VPLIGAARQQAITLDATRDFFAFYLKGLHGARDRLLELNKKYQEAALLWDE
jgi:hypothetical protein